MDVKGATELGIPVVIAPGANTRSVAEHAMAMIFACAKNMLVCDHEMRKGNFGIRSEYKAYELYGKTLGLIGCGHIGKILAELATGVGMKVLVYDPFLKPETVEEWGYGYRADMKDILKEADAISVHTPLTPATKNMIDEPELKLMKPTGILVNCARGGIINEEALCKALKENWIQAAATDVVVHERSASMTRCSSSIISSSRRIWQARRKRLHPAWQRWLPKVCWLSSAARSGIRSATPMPISMAAGRNDIFSCLAAKG